MMICFSNLDFVLKGTRLKLKQELLLIFAFRLLFEENATKYVQAVQNASCNNNLCVWWGEWGVGVGGGGGGGGVKADSAEPDHLLPRTVQSCHPKAR